MLRSWRLIVEPTGANCLYFSLRSIRLCCIICKSDLAFSYCMVTSSHCSMMFSLAIPSLVYLFSTYLFESSESSLRVWFKRFLYSCNEASWFWWSLEIVSISEIFPVSEAASFSLSKNWRLLITCLALLPICFSSSFNIALALLYAINTFCSRNSNSLLMAAISLVSS